MIQHETRILNKTGLHTRPAKELVKLAGSFECDIKIMKDTKVANAKSFLNVISLGAAKGSVIRITADGKDEKEAMQKIVDLIENKFGEDE
ncbi:MAG TPA: HPr family phosphocarrier protein [Bacilli bacterium]